MDELCNFKLCLNISLIFSSTEFSTYFNKIKPKNRARCRDTSFLMSMIFQLQNSKVKEMKIFYFKKDLFLEKNKQQRRAGVDGEK